MAEEAVASTPSLLHHAVHGHLTAAYCTLDDGFQADRMKLANSGEIPTSWTDEPR